MLRATADPSEQLSRQLDVFSQAALKKIAQTLGVAPRNADRASYIEALAKFIGTPRHQSVLEGRMPIRQWSLLDLLPVQAGPVRLRSLIVSLRQSGGTPGEELNALSGAFAHGCLLPVSPLPAAQKLNIDPAALSPWIGSIWFDVPPPLRDWVRQRNPKTHRLASVDPPKDVAVPDVSELQRTVYLLLAEASAKPIRLTSKGLPYKAEQTRLAAALAGGTPGSAGRGARAKREAAPVPPILWFALAALTGARLLALKDQQLYPSDDVAAFRSSPLEAQVGRLISGWIGGLFDDFVRVPSLWFGEEEEEGGSPVPWAVDEGYSVDEAIAGFLPMARAVICTAIGLAARAAPDAWYKIEDLATLVYDDHPEILFEHRSDFELLHPRSFGGPGAGRPARAAYQGVYRLPSGSNAKEDLFLYPERDWPKVEGAFVRQVVGESMRWLGLVELGSGLANPDRFRLTPLGRHLLTGEPLAASSPTGSPQVVVQPNFEVVVVDALANAAVLAQLDELAERRSLDRAATYHLSQAALIRGLDRGWTGQRVLDTLAALSGVPLPQNVLYTLREWIRLYERLSLRERSTLLEADSANQLDHWLADRELAPLLGKRLGPAAILVSTQNLERVTTRVKAIARKLQTIDYAQQRSRILEVRDPDLLEAKTSDPYLDYRLRVFSVPVGANGSNVVYQITAETVRSARKAGRSGVDLANFLATAAGASLPSDFLSRLLGWSGAIPSLTYQSVKAVYLPMSTINWHVLATIPAIGKLIRTVPTPSIALIDEDDFDALLAELASRGVVLQPGILPMDPSPSPTSAFDGLLDPNLVDEAMARILGERLERPRLLGFPFSLFRGNKR